LVVKFDELYASHRVWTGESKRMPENLIAQLYQSKYHPHPRGSE